MTMGRVRAVFFHTRTRLAGQDPWLELGPFIKHIFFSGPRLTPLSPTQPGHFKAQSLAPYNGPICGLIN